MRKIPKKGSEDMNRPLTEQMAAQEKKLNK